MKKLNKNIAKLPLIDLRVWLKHFLIIVCVASVVSCGGGDDGTSSDTGIKPASTTTGTVGPFVPTSSLKISADIAYRIGHAGSFMGIILSDIRGPNNLRLGSGDSLSVIINSVSQVVTESESILCGYFGTNCAYYYEYSFFLASDPGGQPVTISLQRSSDISSSTTVTLPASPTIIQPTAGTAFSVSADPLFIELAPGQLGSFTSLEFFGACLDPMDILIFADTGPFSGSFPPSSFTFSTSPYCLPITERALILTTTRHHTFNLGAPLAAKSEIWVTLGSETTILARQ